MNMDDLKKAVGDVSASQDDKCELIEGAALEACSGGKIPWVKWGMAFHLADGTTGG
jgi:hypothetical protein